MDITSLLDLSGNCISGQLPPCACACPLGLDVRGFVEKIRSGSVSAAYKIYARAAVLPGVACHICTESCQNSCVRREVDAAISLRQLETYCWEECRNKPAESFFIPEKKKRVLIIGGGATGLSCGAKLAQRGYAVELREKNQRLGGKLWDFCRRGALPEDVLTEDLAEIARLKYLNISLNVKVDTLPDKQDLDAILVATGASGDNFGAAPFQSELFLGEGVFFGGSLLHPAQDPLASIRQGIELSYRIENYIKVGRMDLARESSAACLFKPNVQKIEPLAKTLPAAPFRLTKEEAQAEADRCLLCSCNNCMEVCEMLQYFRKSAGKITQEVSATVNKTALNKKTALWPIMSCTQCGLCKPSCPVDIDLKSLFLESRRVLHKNGRLPDGFYDYWLNDMAHSNNEAALFLPPLPGKKHSRYLYFPGCQMGASDPAYVLESYRWLRQSFPGEAALLLSCCGAPAHWAGDQEAHQAVIEEIRAKWRESGKPVLITACPSCHTLFRAHLPEIETVSLWTLMADKYPESAVPKGVAVSVFDPCASKYDPETQASVRRLVRKAGYETVELPAAEEQARCCGYGGLVYSSNPQLVSTIGKHNAALGELEFITYCVNCRDSFAIQKKPSRHILDVLFLEAKARSQRPPTALTLRRTNRIGLKNSLLQEYLGDSFKEDPAAYRTVELLISHELREKMNRGLILEENIQKVISFAEKSDQRALDTSSGVYSAHLRQGRLTFWVQYKPEGDRRYTLYNVYKHRMSIEEPEAGEEK